MKTKEGFLLVFCLVLSILALGMLLILQASLSSEPKDLVLSFSNADSLPKELVVGSKYTINFTVEDFGLENKVYLPYEVLLEQDGQEPIILGSGGLTLEPSTFSQEASVQVEVLDPVVNGKILVFVGNSSIYFFTSTR